MKVKSATMTGLGEVFLDCPPDFSVFLCETPEHFEQFVLRKSFYTDLNHLLTCYFAGEAPPKHFHAQWTEYLNLEAYRLIQLYDVLFFGWEFLDIGTDDTPADVFKTIVLRESYHAFLQCKASWKVHAPRKLRSDFKMLDKYAGLSALAKSPNSQLSAKEQRDFDRVQREVKAYISEKRTQEVRGDLLSLRDGCLRVLREVKKPPPALKLALKAFHKACAETERWVLNQSHPRNAPKGSQVIKGKRSGL